MLLGFFEFLNIFWKSASKLSIITTDLDTAVWNFDMNLCTFSRLGRRGNTVIMSIHQPRYSIFKMFDTISLLSNGEFVYQGPAVEAITYFEDLGNFP